MPQEPLPHAATRKPCDPAKPAGSEDDRLTLPDIRLLTDSSRHVFLQHRAGATLGRDTESP